MTPDTPRSGEPSDDQRPRSEPESGSLPVSALPPDTASHALAAADEEASDPDSDLTTGDPDAERSPRFVMQAYAGALGDGDAATAAAVHAAHAAVFVEGAQLTGRAEIQRWHERLLADGRVRAEPVAQGNDTGRLNVHGPGGDRVVELAFDASGRIGSARWLLPETAAAGQEDRTRRNR